MTPGMTEIVDTEITVVRLPSAPEMPPSDAIILFDGTDVNKEWEDNVRKKLYFPCTKKSTAANGHPPL